MVRAFVAVVVAAPIFLSIPGYFLSMMLCPSGVPPSDNFIRAHFRKHTAEFERIKLLASNLPHLVRVFTDRPCPTHARSTALPPQGNTQAEPVGSLDVPACSLARADCNELRRLLLVVEGESCDTFVESEMESMSILLRGGGVFSGCKYVTWLRRPSNAEPLVQSTDDEGNFTDSDRCCSLLAEGGWYIERFD